MGIEDIGITKAKTRIVVDQYAAEYEALVGKVSNTFGILPAHRSARLNFEQMPYLAGIEEFFAWQVRGERLKWAATPESFYYLLASVGGMQSDGAVKLREDVIGSEMVEKIDQVALGTTFKGLSDPAIVNWRKRKFLEDPKAVLRSLDGKIIDTHSQELRSAIYARAQLADATELKSRTRYLIDSITGSDTSFAWEIRERFFEAFGADVVESLVGIDTERANQMRASFLASKAFDKRPVLKSLVGTRSPATTDIYKGALEDGKIQELFVKQFGIVLAGREDDWSWQLRKRYIHEMDREGWKKLETACFLAQSIQGIDSEESYELRNKIVAMGERLDTEVISALLK